MMKEAVDAARSAGPAGRPPHRSSADLPDAVDTEILRRKLELGNLWARAGKSRIGRSKSPCVVAMVTGWFQ